MPHSAGLFYFRIVGCTRTFFLLRIVSLYSSVTLYALFPSIQSALPSYCGEIPNIILL